MAITITAFFLIKLPKPRCKCKWFVIVTPFSKHPNYLKYRMICQDALKKHREIYFCLTGKIEAGRIAMLQCAHFLSVISL